MKGATMTTYDEERARTHALYHKPQPKKRSGKTPEALVSAAIDKYLEKLDFYVLRTSAGMAEIDGRTIQIGRAGTHDRTCCSPMGHYISIEIKSASGKPTPDQERQRLFIERRHGLVIIARSVADVRAALVERYGETTVRIWEER